MTLAPDYCAVKVAPGQRPSAAATGVEQGQPGETGRHAARRPEGSVEQQWLGNPAPGTQGCSVVACMHAQDHRWQSRARSRAPYAASGRRADRQPGHRYQESSRQEAVGVGRTKLRVKKTRPDFFSFLPGRCVLRHRRQCRSIPMPRPSAARRARSSCAPCGSHGLRRSRAGRWSEDMAFRKKKWKAPVYAMELPAVPHETHNAKDKFKGGQTSEQERRLL